MSASTQEIYPLEDIRDGVIIGKDGSVSMVVQTSAVNFDLLSENEQLAIIGSFAGLLNSLSFAIQIVIRSKRLDITNYLHSLVEAESRQNNPLLKKLMQDYRNFVATIIRENEVLDKQFYIVISVSALELGVVKNVDKNMQKAITLLVPRRDHIIRQLNRIGLKSTQLNDDQLIKLFYDIYNEPQDEKPKTVQPDEPQPLVAAPPAPTLYQQTAIPEALSPAASQPYAPPPPPTSSSLSTANPTSNPYSQLPSFNQAPSDQPPAQKPFTQPVANSRSGPFVTEELPDEFHTV